MAVTYIFTPSTIIASAEVNTNFTDITTGAALNNMTSAIIAMANLARFNLKNASAVNDFAFERDANNNIKVYTNQIVDNIANPETFRLVKIIVPSGFATGGDIQAAVDDLDAVTTKGVVELLPGSHFLEASLTLSGKISLIGSGPEACQIRASTGTFVGNEVITVTSDECSILNLGIVGVGDTYVLDIGNQDRTIVDNVILEDGTASTYAFFIGTIGEENMLNVRINGSARPYDIQGDKNMVRLQHSGTHGTNPGLVSGDRNMITQIVDFATTDTGTANNIREIVY